MTDLTQQDTLEDQVEFRLSKKAKCVCFQHRDGDACESFVDGHKNSPTHCARTIHAPSGMVCAHLRACHAPSPTQEQ